MAHSVMPFNRTITQVRWAYN